MLTNNDLTQIKEHGLTVDTIIKQLETFRKGIPPVDIVTAASVGNGIEVIPENVQDRLVSLYDEKKQALDIVKFVPASGAATRMFKFLHEFLQTFNPEEDSFKKYVKKHGKEEVEIFFNNFKLFPFVNAVRKTIREQYPDYKNSNKGIRNICIAKAMLEKQGLGYHDFPKGLIPFHKYKKYATTAFEEQLYESAYYASASSDVYLHFTFAEKHVPFFKEEFEAIKKRVTFKTKKEFHISYSFQKKETDTLAVKNDDTPFRDANGKLVFRPSGHGALLDNLNDVDADVIFIKNIDNVVIEPYVEQLGFYKRLLAGKLLFLQAKVFDYINKLQEKTISDELYKELKSFFWNELNCKDVPADKHQMLYLLDRPIRVCGVVKNTGAPGGGPFWVKNEYGHVSVQIVEMSQIDKKRAEQIKLLNEATHFNPVDIVCSTRNYKGEKYDLKKFANQDLGFIASKSVDGKNIKALERPGLWNGAMYNWNTVFVEVPQETFNPVKTVNDLLNKPHRPDA